MKTNVHKFGIAIFVIAIILAFAACKNSSSPIYSAEDLAGVFKVTHADALALDLESVSMEDELIINAALKDYAGLGNEVKELLEKEKALLDDLKAKIDELNAAAAAAFKAAHADALALTLDTVTVTTENKKNIDAALTDYAILGYGVKVLLILEKSLLDSLIARIDDIQSFFGTYTRTQGYENPYTVTIDADSFNFIDRNGAYIHHANIIWTQAENTATTGTAALRNPSVVYPSGYTITGDRTSKSYSATTLIPSPFFMALSAGKNQLYVATSADNYNKAGFVEGIADSIFIRVK